MATAPTTSGNASTSGANPTSGNASTSGVGAAAPAVVAGRTEEELDQMAASSIGAQVILDYNSDAGKGARGGAGGTIEENTQARDANLVAVGLDPNAPSGPPTGQPWEPPVQVARRASGPAATGTATRMSSLAAGVVTGDQGGTTPPPGGGNGGQTPAAPVNTAIPAVTQAGDTLTCTQGTWNGEPTAYAYAWTVDGASAGTDSATHTVTAADAGKTASCIVTATNATGSTAAPPSADMTIADPGAGTRASRK